MKLLLASRSEARRRMLAAAGVPFGIADTACDEQALKATLAGLGPVETAHLLAEGKALGVAADADALVLGADQVLELHDGALLSKARSREELADQLARMSGTSHRLYSAASIVESGAIVWRGLETVEMAMRPLSQAFIRDYLDAEYVGVRWSVGGYHVEGRGAQLFEHIEGSHFAVQGLPLLLLLKFLRDRKVLAS